MRTVRLEQTSIRTSRLGLGTSSLHHLVSGAARRRLLEHAWSRGIRYFDTAPLYGHELAERELGRFMRGRREEVVVATKFGLVPSPLLSRLPSLMYGQKVAKSVLGGAAGVTLARSPRRDYGARYARERVERSLSVMATEYIDILYLHEPTLTQIREPAELIATLNELRRSGKIRAVGISGTREECRRITLRYPELGQVWQVDVHEPPTLHVPRTVRRPMQVTFGHFREAAGAATSTDREHGIERSLAAAVEINPSGVILFSTRKLEHLDSTVAMLAMIEERIDRRRHADS